MFSLAKLAYFACDEKSRYWYNTKPKCVIKIDLCGCCIRLLTDNDHYKDLSFSWMVSDVAANYGHLDCLMRCKQKSLPLSNNMCNLAAISGNIDCLIFARENGCIWSSITCMNAAKYGHFDCLKYLRENGCPWDYRTIMYSAYSNHRKCLQYAISNGCPADKLVLWNARISLLVHGATSEEINAMGL